MKYIFSGKIYPERTTLSLPQLKGEMAGEDTDFKGKIEVSIILSQVTVELDSASNLTTTDFKNIVESFVYTMVDVYGYLKGYAYSVEISSVYIPETNYNEVFGIDVKKITEDEKNRPLKYEEMLQLALRTPALYMALKDLRDAIKRPLDTFFHCRRTTETIMNYFMKSGNKANGWKDMIRTLELEEKSLKEIKILGGDQRHGKYQSVTGEKRVEIMMKTWKVVDKFSQYLKSQEKKQ